MWTDPQAWRERAKAGPAQAAAEQVPRRPIRFRDMRRDEQPLASPCFGDGGEGVDALRAVAQQTPRVFRRAPPRAATQAFRGQPPVGSGAHQRLASRLFLDAEAPEHVDDGGRPGGTATGKHELAEKGEQDAARVWRGGELSTGQGRFRLSSMWDVWLSTLR